jgi:hypothetical protein
MTARRGGRLLPFFTGVSTLLAMTAPTGGAAGGRPDLVETTVVAAPGVVAAGASIRVTDTVRNSGGAPAAASTTGYYLARAKSGGVLLGRRRVRLLRPGSVSRASKSVRIPVSAEAGRYLLLACADVRHRVRESNEADNCRTAAQRVTVTKPPPTDDTPPTFAGLQAAVTCIPGPVGGSRTASYHLRWDPASDDVTPASEIVYDVYLATSPGAERFSSPTYTTSPGATLFATPPLPSMQTYYFVVRAHDRAGNREQNWVERLGVNLCV